MFILWVHTARVLGADLSWFSPLSWASCQKLAGPSVLHTFLLSTFESKSGSRTKGLFLKLIWWGAVATRVSHLTFKKETRNVQQENSLFRKQGEWWKWAITKYTQNLHLEYQPCLLWRFYIAVLRSKLCISLPLQDSTADYSHKAIMSVCALVLIGIELIFSIVHCMGLCFGFVLKTVLITHRCFRYCWAVLREAQPLLLSTRPHQQVDWQCRRTWEGT